MLEECVHLRGLLWRFLFEGEEDVQMLLSVLRSAGLPVDYRVHCSCPVVSLSFLPYIVLWKRLTASSMVVGTLALVEGFLLYSITGLVLVSVS